MPFVLGFVAVITGSQMFASAVRIRKLALTSAKEWPQAKGKVLKSSYRRASMGSVQSRDPRKNSDVLDFSYQCTTAPKKHIWLLWRRLCMERAGGMRGVLAIVEIRVLVMLVGGGLLAISHELWMGWL